MELENRESIIEWAHATVKANGEKFTPLSKKSQWAIARYIVEINDATTSKMQCSDADDAHNSKLLTRAEYLQSKGFEVQKAFDLFLQWAKDMKSPTSVMDFGTGHRSEAAAFAYWLMGQWQ